MSFACSAGRLARTRMCVMIVFHWADVNSVGYRSGWQRLQLMAYNSAPVSFFFLSVFFSGGWALARDRPRLIKHAPTNTHPPHETIFCFFISIEFAVIFCSTRFHHRSPAQNRTSHFLAFRHRFGELCNLF